MPKSVRSHCLVCAGGGCIACGALEVSAAMREAVAAFDLSEEVKVIETGCLGPCAVGPVMVIYPEGTFYQNVKPEDAKHIVEEHLLKGRVVERLVHQDRKTHEPEREMGDITFFRRQVKVVLRNCGVIDPLKIEEYIAREGYMGAARALTEMTPEQVIDEVKRSGLRGRGGAGFPAGLKWELTRKSAGDEKYILCNADEGDPGAFMDRSVLEGDPHSIIEGMMIAGYAIGARHGFVYVRAEYPLAVERLQHAMGQAREMGLLGTNVFGSGFDFDLEIRMGSGAFVCGEETALMTSIEGKRGEPRPRPPYPAHKGLWGKPSCLNNVETFANVPMILTKGADWYASMGTEKSKGTKVFALAGAINNTGLVEVPIGMSLGELLYDVGGGIPGGKKFKAAQMGGPSGGCIPREHLNVPVDYESLQELGAIMGSGGLIVMDEDSCMVDVARFFLEFVQEESCGKCTPCRVGTKRMLEIVTRITEGKGEMADLDKLMELGQQIRETSLCGLGQTAPNPVLSTLRHFRDEYIAHIRDKKCPAGVCADLTRAPCMTACPAGVYVPGYVSLIGEARYAEAMRVHRENNPLAAVCARVCFHACEDKCRRSGLDESVGIRGLKRFMADQETTWQLPEIRINDEAAKRKVAIVGAGPSGLACGYFLARLGYRPTIFESEPRAGGMLVQAIPAYRLPREIVDREVSMIERIGVELRYSQRLGRDFTLPDLRGQGYEAVFLGVGAPSGQRLGVPGDEAEGIVEALDYLREYNLRGTAAKGERVLVIGGGNAAVDAARTAVRLGAQNVTLLYRRTREEMPAYAEEVEEAEREGVRMKFLVAPVEVLTQNGRVCGVRAQQMSLGAFDRSGRRRPVATPGGEFVIEGDLVIAAVGQTLDPSFLGVNGELRLRDNHFIVADPITGRTTIPWLFSGGDAVVGPSSVAEAVGGGERAAVGIDRMFTGKENAFWRLRTQVDTAFDPDADPILVPRAPIRTLPAELRMHNFREVEQPWTETEALREARRCLRCDFRCA
ncbi:MAG: NADH-quinone oxidoreductase subunit NuoF [Deltaproteobacteria bacterium]|nr:NADH-quinone oxidoreductase subunit NuoF [Deltaproteobacteria bacterium]